MSNESNLQLVQQTYAAFGRGDGAAILSVMADDIVWESRYPAVVPFAGDWHGHDGVKQLLAKLSTSIDVQQFAPQDFVSSGDKVVVLGFEEATTKTTGRMYRNEWVHVWTIQDGKVRHLKNYNDTAVVAAAFA